MKTTPPRARIRPRYRGGVQQKLARGLVEEIVDLAGGLFIDARHLGEIDERGALDGLERAEVVQQRALAGRPNARNFLQPGLPDVLLSPGAVRADCKAM